MAFGLDLLFQETEGRQQAHVWLSPVLDLREVIPADHQARSHGGLIETKP